MKINLFSGGKMASPPQFLYRDVSFHPPEADRLAEKIAEHIRNMRSEQSHIDTHVSNLNSDWEGHHKEIFLSDVNPHQKKGSNSIEQLRKQEQYFRHLMITRREAYTNPAWDAYVNKK
jgi:hypothetical protein